jgi:hypothetical protein
MCIPSRTNNSAKLGFENAIRIMSETSDYRLYHFMREQLKEAKRPKQQLDFFAEPQRNLEERQ